VAVSLFFASSVKAEDILVRAWPEELRRSISAAADDAKTAFVNILFNSLDDFNLFSVHDTDRKFRLGLNVKREVYDNFDLTGTWTVIDRLELKGGARPFDHLSTIDLTKVTPNLGLPFASVSFDATTSFLWTNVRQVSAHKIREIPDTDEVAREFRSRMESKPELSEVNPYTPWYLIDPSIRPRFGKLWNLISFPFRTPFTAKSLKRLSDGEVISYTLLNATVEIGGTVGWKIIPDPLARTAGADLRITTFIEGQFLVSIMKENSRFVRVKITRLGKLGLGKLGFGSRQFTVGANFKQILKGKLFFAGEGVSAKVVPFEWKATDANLSQFDVVYRYDLENPDAIDAYQRAVWGAFGLSEELAFGPNEMARYRVSSPTYTPAVERLFRREGSGKNHDEYRLLQISLLLKGKNEKNRSDLEAHIEMPDGNHVIHRGLTEKNHSSDIFFGASREKVSRKFTVLLDEEKFQRNEKDSLFVISESFFEDSRTRGRELRKITGEIETFLNRPELFPDLPDFIPDPEHPNRSQRAYYGRSSFYYGFSLDREKVEAFLKVPPSQRREWVNLAITRHPESRFVSRSLETERLLRHWDKAATAYAARDAKILFQALREFFEPRGQEKALMQIVRFALAGQSLDYFLSAQNIGFGRIQERGKITTPVEKLMTLMENTLGFEGTYKRALVDPEAVVSEVKSSIRPDGLVEVQFTIGTDPKSFFFRLTRTTPLRRNKILSEITISNASLLFKAGENKLVFDPNGAPGSLAYKLGHEIHSGEYYTLSVGYSRDGQKFGPAASLRFRAPPIYPKETETSPRALEEVKE
jgi:hypothetical protein